MDLSFQLGKFLDELTVTAFSSITLETFSGGGLLSLLLIFFRKDVRNISTLLIQQFNNFFASYELTLFKCLIDNYFSTGKFKYINVKTNGKSS